MSSNPCRVMSFSSGRSTAVRTIELKGPHTCLLVASLCPTTLAKTRATSISTQSNVLGGSFPLRKETIWSDPLRSEEHTSELQSRQYLVCRLLLEKKKMSNRNQEITVKNDRYYI